MPKIYRCPDCISPEMILKVDGRKYRSYVCPVCDALLMVEIFDKKQKVKIGDVEIACDNARVADILNDAFNQKNKEDKRK
jgi:hypothetical protein